MTSSKENVSFPVAILGSKNHPMLKLAIVIYLVHADMIHSPCDQTKSSSASVLYFRREWHVLMIIIIITTV